MCRICIHNYSLEQFVRLAVRNGQRVVPRRGLFEDLSECIYVISNFSEDFFRWIFTRLVDGVTRRTRVVAVQFMVLMINAM